jgi:cytoskeletal protein CcmA (bactofilin family)
MFQKNTMPILREGAQEAETVIAASVKVEGDFASQGNVLIEGAVEGKLSTAKDLRVGERAHIAADVSATNAVVAGEIRGNLVVSEKLDLEPTARIMGDVRAKILTVAAGAVINGRVAMGPEAGEPTKRPVQAPKFDAPKAESAGASNEEPKSGVFGGQH